MVKYPELNLRTIILSFLKLVLLDQMNLIDFKRIKGLKDLPYLESCRVELHCDWLAMSNLNFRRAKIHTAILFHVERLQDRISDFI